MARKVQVHTFHINGYVITVRKAPVPRVKKASASPAEAANVVTFPQPKRVDPALDERTVAELWVAGETADARRKAVKRQKVGEHRRVVVRFADGFEVRTGGYEVDDAALLAGAVRFARGRRMEVEFERRGQAFGPRHGFEQLADEGWRWVRLSDGSSRQTRVAAIPAVVSREIVPPPSRLDVALGRFVAREREAA